MVATAFDDVVKGAVVDNGAPELWRIVSNQSSYTTFQTVKCGHRTVEIVVTTLDMELAMLEDEGIGEGAVSVTVTGAGGEAVTVTCKSQKCQTSTRVKQQLMYELEL